MKFEFLGKLRGDDSGNAASQGGGPPTAAGEGGLPIDEVRRLSNQGYSESEITEELRDRGYSYREINEAMNTAVQSAATSSGGGGTNMAQQQDEFDDTDWEPQDSQTFDDYDQGGQVNQQPQPQQPQQQPAEPAYNDQGYEDDWSASGASVSPDEEELIEIIVSEHATELENEVDQVRNEMDTLRQQLQDLQDSFQEIDVRRDEDEQVVVQKVNEMEEYFEETHSRMGGMEKALQQVLPALVENVRELSSIVREMKEEKNPRR